LDTKELLIKLSNSYSISGNEKDASNIFSNEIDDYVDVVNIDKLGNTIAIKKGINNKNDIKIMLAAHIDEIGLMVKDIDENGFIRFTTIGGIDPRTLLCQEVIVHGNEELYGVIGAKPPHFQTEDEKRKSLKVEDLTIDVGYSKEKLLNLVKIGDTISIKRDALAFNDKRVAGKSLDNKAGVAAIIECAKELDKIKHEADVYFVATVQEEVGLRGATVSTYNIDPDIGIAIDVGFGYTPDIRRDVALEFGKGPGITIGGNIHPNLRKQLIKLAKEYNIPFQYEIEPGPTGTDARAIQITRCGIPTLCISIPLRYMHTSVEIIDIRDIKNTAKLLALFILSISKDNMEGLLCF
jgi:putative aminopeptidase FrvX